MVLEVKAVVLVPGLFPHQGSKTNLAEDFLVLSSSNDCW
jgi:hypothetical protein